MFTMIHRPESNPAAAVLEATLGGDTHAASPLPAEGGSIPSFEKRMQNDERRYKCVLSQVSGLLCRCHG